MIEARCGHRMRAGLPTDRWKKSLEHYLASARALYGAMVHEGFNPSFPIPVDPDGELLDGSHRLACALALGLVEVPVERRDQFVWAPPWGETWFETQGMTASDLQRIREDWNALRML